MMWKKQNNMLFVALFLAFVVGGCAGYGHLRVVDSKSTSPVTLTDLVNDMEKFTVWAGGWSPAQPTAVLFDPRDDNRTLVPHRWTRVETRQKLLEVIQWLRMNQVSRSVLWKVLGPDGEFYGYVYTPWINVPMKRIDEGTMQVYDLPHPPLEKSAKE